MRIHRVAPKSPSTHRKAVAKMHESLIGACVYFHKVFGRKGTGKGISKETQVFTIVGVTHLYDGKIAYRVVCDADPVDSLGSIVQPEDVYFLEVGGRAFEGGR